MTSTDDVFEQTRDRLFGVAYRMTGSVADANDICQDAWLRWQASDASLVQNAEAYLVRVVTRLAIDRATSATARRVGYVGAYLPEPVFGEGAGDDASGPESAAMMADSMTFAFLVVLDELSPIERAVFLLHDVFGYAFTEIASAVDRSDAACRQIASRARKRVHAHPTEPRRTTLAEERIIIDRAIERIMLGDVGGLMELLAPDVVELDDGGPRVRAARYPIVGPERVARFLINLAKRLEPGGAVDVATVNGRVGLYFRNVSAAGMVMTFDTNADGKVCRIFAQLNPDKLRHLNAGT
jgi:RNA polymerase sigma-70 factor, ECF subfamily